jgi:hypothetical protein
MTQTAPRITPLDPDSEAGRACAAELTVALGSIKAAVLERRRQAARNVRLDEQRAA